MHQLTANADVNELDQALGALRQAGWPMLEGPNAGDDEELAGLARVVNLRPDAASEQWQRAAGSVARPTCPWEQRNPYNPP